MRKDIILGAFALLLMTGCYSLKKATKQVAKAGSIYPELVASNCANLFPIKTLSPVIIPGKTVVIPGDTIHVPGVRIPCPPNGKDTVWQDCPPSTIYHDTIKQVDTLRVEYENTARISAQQLEIAALNAKVADTLKDQLKAENKADKRGTTIVWLIGGLLLSIGWNFRKLIFKMFV